MKTPVRYDGTRWGFSGGVCSSCRRALMHNPQAAVRPDRYGIKPRAVTLAKLADAALAVCYGLETQTVEELQRRVAVLRRLAEAAQGLEG